MFNHVHAEIGSIQLHVSSTGGTKGLSRQFPPLVYTYVQMSPANPIIVSAALGQTLEELFDHCPLGVAIMNHRTDEDGTIVAERIFVNTAFIKMFGAQSAEELTNSPVSRSWLDPALLAQVNDRFKAGDYLVDFEAQRIRLDGSIFWVSMTSQPIDIHGNTYTIIWHLDIEERKSAELALAESSQRLKAYLENIPAFVSLKDKDGVYVAVNREFSSRINLTEAEVIGKSTLELGLDEHDARWLVEIDQEVIESGRPITREAVVHLPGGVFDRRTTKFPIFDAEGKPNGVGTIAVDLSRERENDAIRAASQAKSNFLMSMSHELRTPLNSILGFAQLLANDSGKPLAEDHQRFVDRILQNGEHLLDLIDQVLDLTRIEVGGQDLSVVDVQVLPLLESCLQIVLPSAMERDVCISIEDTIVENLRCSADQTMLRQVLLNVLSNAVKYNDAGGQVRIRASRVASVVRIEIEDTGVGIPLEKQEFLFEPFNRLGREATEIQGAGIGLTITKKLVDLLEGEISFRSVVGEGTCFTIDIPAAADEA